MLENVEGDGGMMCLKMWKEMGHYVLENVEGDGGMMCLKMWKGMGA